ncbi:hypothetical protein HYU22_04440 [Candidatus Woesearchaeota archaeon]|nr:hypothetical protein [Candidatus Woesearchaeota archaeon]
MRTIPRTILLSVLLISVLLLASSVQALVDFSAAPVVDVDYAAFREDQQTIPSAGQFTLRNTDLTPVTVQLSIQFTGAGYSIANLPASVTIPGNSTLAVDFTLNVPHRNEPGSASIGTVQVRDNAGTLLISGSLVQDTKEMLIIRNLGIDYTDTDDSARDQDFDAEEENDFRIERDIKPGTDITLTFEIENRFRDSDYENSDIENVELSVDVDDSDLFPSDFDDKYDFVDLQAKDKQTEEVRFTIPDDASSGNYILEFTLEGEDGQGINYQIVKTLSLDLSRPDDDVRITQANVTSVLTVCDTVIPFRVTLKNYGSDNQRYTALRLIGAPLRITENIVDIELDEFDTRKDSWSQSFAFAMPKITPGTYPVDVYAYIDRDKQIDYKKVNVVVQSCPASEEPSAPQNESVVPVVVASPPRTTTIQPSTTLPTASGAAEPTRISSGAVVDITENPYSQENFLVGIFIVAIVLVLALIVIFFIILMMR